MSRIMSAEDELEALCRACGLCCDGSLFGCAPLEPGEIARARANRLRVLPRETTFEQPCSALATRSDGRACAIYADRPRACRAFVCRLYDRHLREGGPIGRRLAAVRAVRELLERLETTTDQAARGAIVPELRDRIDEDFRRA